MFHIQWNLLIHSVWFEMRAHTHPKKLWIKIYSSWSSWIETITFWNSDSNSRWLGRELHREWHDFEFVFFWWHFFSDVLIVLHSHNSRLIFIDHKCRLFSPFIPYFVPVKNATNTQLEPLLNERMNEWMNIWFSLNASKNLLPRFSLNYVSIILKLWTLCYLLIYCHNMCRCATESAVLLNCNC